MNATQNSRNNILAEMQDFVTSTLSARPKTKTLYGKIVRPLNDGKSGAHVFEMQCNRVLKLYPPFTDPTDWHLQRSLRDIVMTKITPDTISPRVIDYGISRDMRPFMLTEKIDGVELFSYQPVGGARDIQLLFDIVQALREFNASFRYFCRFYGVGMQRPCHRDLHPHNIFVTAHGVRFIDFDLAVCPLTAICDSDSPQRQRALRHPWLQYILGNYSYSTEMYVHWSNILEYAPPLVQNDSDLLQVFTMIQYFHKYNPILDHVLSVITTCKDKEDFLNNAQQALATALGRTYDDSPPERICDRVHGTSISQSNTRSDKRYTTTTQ